MINVEYVYTYIVVVFFSFVVLFSGYKDQNFSFIIIPEIFYAYIFDSSEHFNQMSSAADLNFLTISLIRKYFHSPYVDDNSD